MTRDPPRRLVRCPPVHPARRVRGAGRDRGEAGPGRATPRPGTAGRSHCHHRGRRHRWQPHRRPERQPGGPVCALSGAPVPMERCRRLPSREVPGVIGPGTEVSLALPGRDPRMLKLDPARRSALAAHFAEIDVPDMRIDIVRGLEQAVEGCAQSPRPDGPSCPGGAIRLHGRVALITGGARGQGRLARRAARA